MESLMLESMSKLAQELRSVRRDIYRHPELGFDEARTSALVAERLRRDQPDSAFFVNRKTGLRIDVLFDFPVLARELAGRSVKVRTPVGALRRACEPDLLRLKLIAQANRTLASDAQDVSFLEDRRQ
jgi:hypothetical protein